MATHTSIHARTHAHIQSQKSKTTQSKVNHSNTRRRPYIPFSYCFFCHVSCAARCGVASSERSYSFYFSLTPRSAVSYAIVFLSLFVCLSFASVHTVLPLLFFMRSARVLVFKFLLSFLPYPCRETQFNAKSEMCVAYTESTCSSLCRQL